MSATRRFLVITFALSAAMASATTVRAQSSLNAARDLYAAAAYDDALTALNALSARDDGVSDAGTVSLYRALCLYALGRHAEGDRAVELLVEEHPLYRPPMDELSPRMRATVTETRRRLLPVLLQQKYAEAKAAYQRSEFAAAAEGFTAVITGLEDPDIAQAASQSPLADLATLSSEFRDLAVKALTPALAPIAPSVILPAPVVAPAVARVYSAADAEATAPIAVRQTIPAFTRPVLQKKMAIVEVLIDEAGDVESAAMLTSLDPAYDRTVVAAARGWRYEPATVDGKPVKYQKRVQITLVPTAR